MHLPEEKKLKILGIVKESLQGEEPYSIFLFGSYATGKAHAKSDIDIALKAAQPLNLAKWQKLDSLLEESDLLEKVDVVDFNRVSETFQKVILKEGILLQP